MCGEIGQEDIVGALLTGGISIPSKYACIWEQGLDFVHNSLSTSSEVAHPAALALWAFATSGGLMSAVMTGEEILISMINQGVVTTRAACHPSAVPAEYIRG